MDRIKFNLGNPIKSREMFFGREDDFQFVAREIGEGRSNQIVVLCGERRSGKTSILFQILGGRLGDAVNTAARVESRAEGDEIIVSAAVREGAPQVERRIGESSLLNHLRSSPARTSDSSDPRCRAILRPDLLRASPAARGTDRAGDSRRRGWWWSSGRPLASWCDWWAERPTPRLTE